jgi:hypothetical protein
MIGLSIVLGSSPLLMQAQAQSAPSIEDSPVWRVQLLLTTADVWGGSTWGGSDTDNFVDVRLNFNNSTRLYSSFNNANDFERGKTHIYDLTLENVRTLRDIQMIQLSKPGTDSWCIQALTLLVNGRAIYDIDFPGVGSWMGTNAVLYRLSPELRIHPLWRAYTVPPAPQAIWASDLINRIDGAVGDFIGGGALRSGTLPAIHYWHPAGEFLYSVHVSGNGPRMLHVKVDLGYWYNTYSQNFDLDFDLEFSCGAGKLFVNTRDLDMSYYPVSDNLTANNKAILGTFLQLALPMQLQSAFQAVTYRNDLGQPACPPVRIVGNSVYLF